MKLASFLRRFESVGLLACWICLEFPATYATAVGRETLHYSHPHQPCLLSTPLFRSPLRAHAMHPSVDAHLTTVCSTVDKLPAIPLTSNWRVYPFVASCSSSISSSAVIVMTRLSLSFFDAPTIDVGERQESPGAAGRCALIRQLSFKRPQN